MLADLQLPTESIILKGATTNACILIRFWTTDSVAMALGSFEKQCSAFYSGDTPGACISQLLDFALAIILFKSWQKTKNKGCIVVHFVKSRSPIAIVVRHSLCF